MKKRTVGLMHRAWRSEAGASKRQPMQMHTCSNPQLCRDSQPVPRARRSRLARRSTAFVAKQLGQGFAIHDADVMFGCIGLRVARERA